jgi:hypothetical protein
MTNQSRKKTKATIWIVESLGYRDENTRKEGEIISRTLRLSGKQTDYTYLRTQTEFKAFVKEFGQSTHRYLHISCHGNESEFCTTTGRIPALKFAQILAPNLKNPRRVFLSTCLATNNKFAKALLLESKCLSVLGPAGEINFDDAAIFWSAFYHLMFKENSDSMQNDKIKKNVLQCAKLVGEQFRLFYKKGGKVKQELLG